MVKITEEERERRAVARARREAITAEQEEHRFEERRKQWHRDGAYLSREEAESGVPCRGCGELLRDGRGSWYPLMQLTPEEKLEYEAADVRYRERHAGCHACRWSVSGSRTWHCGYCCPPPPMSQEQIDYLQQFLARKTHPRDLNEWRLTLTCEHVVEQAQHRENTSWTTCVVSCPTCGVRRGVVQAELVGPAADPDVLVEREQLNAELTRMNQSLARQRKAAASTERRIDELKAQLDRLEAANPGHDVQL